MATLSEGLKQRARARVGRQLGARWRLEQLLGVGGVAAVYAAQHRNGRRAAVKVLHPELALDESIRRRFLREGYVANRVGHPGVVAVLDDAIDEDGTVFLVMELLCGETLEARCKRCGGRLEPEPALVIAACVLEVVCAAHAKGVLHRDITPANVFVTTDGVVKLLDFGIARLRDTSGEPFTMSAPGTLGTPGFMAPEQARGLWENVDERTDLWSLGATLFRALAGRPVHEGRTTSEQLLHAMTRPAPLVSSVRSDLPSALDEFLETALAFENSARFASAKVMLTSLEELYREIIGRSISEAAPLAAPPASDELAVTERPSQSRAVATGVSTTSLAFRKSAPGSPRRAAVWLALLAAGSLAVIGAAALLGQPPQPEARSLGSAAGIPVAQAPSPSATAHEPAPAPAPSEKPPAREPAPVRALSKRRVHAIPAVTRSQSTISAQPAVSGSVPGPAVDPDDRMFDRRE